MDTVAGSLGGVRGLLPRTGRVRNSLKQCPGRRAMALETQGNHTVPKGTGRKEGMGHQGPKHTIDP